MYIHCVAFIGGRPKGFIKLFQTEAPVMHILYEKVNEVIRIRMQDFIKAEIVGDKEGCELNAESCELCDNLLPLNDVDIDRKSFSWESESV